MKNSRKDLIIPPEDCKMMDLMIKAGFSKLHPGGKFSTEKLLEFFKIDHNKKVIDIGCGPGETTIYIAKKYGCHVTGVDIMPEMIKQAKKNAIKEKVDHLTRFEIVDAMTPVYYNTSFDIAIFQAVLIFGNKQKMLNFAYQVLKDKGQVGAIELTWKNDPPEEIKETFSRKLAKPLINVGNKRDWLSNFTKAGFRETVCRELQSMNIGSFIRMWIGEEWSNKIKIVFKCLTNIEVIQRMFTVLHLFNKYPDNLKYGFYLSQK
jgi:ubiquinone/menaquinone biosynthesis C-methylase UbiE